MNYLESIFNNIDEGLVILSPDGDILYFNEESRHIHQKIGVNLRSNENVFTYFPNEIAERIRKGFEEVKNTHQVVQAVSERKSEDGTILFVEVKYIPTIEEGNIIHINILLRDVSVNKIFEKKITNMATELRNLIDQANAVIVGLDTRGYITDWNRHTKSLTGFSKNDAFTQKFSELLMAESDRQAFNAMLQQVLDGQPVLNKEIPVISRNGEKLIFLLSATSRFNSAGQVIGVIFVGQDITMRRRIEQELKFAHERLLFHLENSPLGFIDWDNQLSMKSCTKHAEEIFGWAEHDFVNKNQSGYNLIYEQDLPWVSRIVDELLNGRIDSNHMQYRNIRKDGTVIWCEWFNSVLKDGDGKVITLMSLVQDITDRKENELRLQEAQTVARLGNWELNLKSREVKWSEEIFRILGFKPSNLESSLDGYFAMVHPDDIDHVKRMVHSFLDEHTPQSYYHRIVKDGKEKSLFVVAKIDFDTSNKATRIYGTIMDVSEITEKERQLQQVVEELEAYKKSLEIKVEERTKDLMQALKKEKDVVEMKSRFVSIASHEFRTPLSSIQHNTNFIRKNKRWSADDELGEKLKDIEKQSKHMMFLLDDVLTYGKSEAGKIQLIVTRIKVKEFLEKIIEDVGHATKGTHFINLKLEGEIVEIETDEKLLRNVLINLLTNAIKYSAEKNMVRLEVEATRYIIKFKVIDQGMGIPQEDIERVFEAFVRGRGVDGIQGTGLGLSIVKKAIELLQGKIEIESEVERGTTVMVTIPTLAK
jgi:PAS domain S-box-containing protein